MWNSSGERPEFFDVLERIAQATSALRSVMVSHPSPSRQLNPGRGSPSESLLPTRRSARLQGPRAGHQRGLVVEVAPRVITCVVDSNSHWIFKRRHVFGVQWPSQLPWSPFDVWEIQCRGNTSKPGHKSLFCKNGTHVWGDDCSMLHQGRNSGVPQARTM